MIIHTNGPEVGLQIYIEALRKALPPVFAGQHIGRLTGGVFSWGSIKNLRYAGEIPETCFGPRYGRSHALTPMIRELFLDWLEKRVEVCQSRPEIGPIPRGLVRDHGSEKLDALPGYVPAQALLIEGQPRRQAERRLKALSASATEVPP